MYDINSIVFNNWLIKRKIGAGSFGTVFEIQREDFGETYRAALKVISVPQSEAELQAVMDEGMSKKEAEAYFYSIVEDIVREFAIMAKLKGTGNVVNYEDHTVIRHTDGIGWDILIRMELLNPLLPYAYAHPFARRDIIRLGIDICKALELCQKYNIIHRDIKPDNIFVSDNGDFKLGDFGIARTIEKTMSALSKKGTYNYMAPEVYRGNDYGFSVDTYSLGIVLYRLLNKNRTPFLPPAPEPITFRSREASLVKRMSGDAMPAPVYAQGRLSEIVLKACAFNPQDRYSSPMQMRAELEAILYETEDSELIYPDGDELQLAENIYLSKSGSSQDDGLEASVDSKTESIFSGPSQIPEDEFDSSVTESIFNKPDEKKTDSGKPKYAVKEKANKNIKEPAAKGGNKKKVIIAAAAVIVVMVTAGAFVKVNDAAKKERYEQIITDAADYCISDPQKAAELYLEAQELCPKETEPYVSYAYALYCAREYDECITYIEDTLALGKEYDVDVQNRISEILGAAYFEKGDFAAAASFFRLSTAGGDITASAMRDYAVSLGRLGDIDAANEVLQRMKDAGDSSDATSYVQAEVDYSLRNYTAAENGFKYVIENAADIDLQKRAIRTLAEVYRECTDLSKTGKSPIETPALKEVSLLADGISKYEMQYDSSLWEMLGMAYFEAYHTEGNAQKSFLSESAKCFNRVIELGIKKEYLYGNLYSIYYELGDYSMAEDALADYEEEFPNDYLPHAFRAMLLITIENNKKEANRNYSKALEEYQLAGKMLTSSDDRTYYLQLESLISQLRNNGWIK